MLKMRFSILRFQGVELYFKNLDWAKSFYSGIFGLELTAAAAWTMAAKTLPIR
jgi:predicted enzyme related to lactoylglutathione lyase